MSRSQSSRVPERRRRSETGDTLIEVLLALVVLGLASVALLTAFATSISASGEHRSLTTVDTLLKSFAETAISQIEQNPYQSCALDSTYMSGGAEPISYTLPTGDSALHYSVGIDSSIPVSYWNGTTFVPGPPTALTCPTSSTAPQEITAQATGPYNTTETLAFVVDDPLAPPPPAVGTPTHLVFLNSPSNSPTGSAFGLQPVVAEL